MVNNDYLCSYRHIALVPLKYLPKSVNNTVFVFMDSSFVLALTSSLKKKKKILYKVDKARFLKNQCLLTLQSTMGLNRSFEHEFNWSFKMMGLI